MKNTRAVVLACSAAAAVGFGGVVFGINALAKSPTSNILVATSPSPNFKSNEDAAHEKKESAAQEAAENNGTFHPGPGAPGGPGGKSNEDPTHEKGETPAHEAAENS
jgi:hypothetical protein